MVSRNMYELVGSEKAFACMICAYVFLPTDGSSNVLKSSISTDSFFDSLYACRDCCQTCIPIKIKGCVRWNHLLPYQFLQTARPKGFLTSVSLVRMTIECIRQDFKRSRACFLYFLGIDYRTNGEGVVLRSTLYKV